MSESQVTIEGTRHILPAPFLVLATQNPIDFHGTYPLPEAQMDRFMMLLNLGYPDSDIEVNILFSQAKTHPLEQLQSVLTCDDIIEMHEHVKGITIDESIAQYIVNIVKQTRHDSRLKLGASPRGSLMLFRAAQAAAFAAGRDFVLPDDVHRLAPHVLGHRIMLTSKAKYGSENKSEIISEILAQTQVPT